MATAAGSGAEAGSGGCGTALLQGESAARKAGGVDAHAQDVARAVGWFVFVRKREIQLRCVHLQRFQEDRARGTFAVCLGRDKATLS